MKRNSIFGPGWLVAGLWFVLSVGFPLSRAAQSGTPGSAALEMLVADVLEGNPELGFYRAEIRAAEGGHRTAGTRQNPALSVIGGRRHVTAGGLSAEGVAWSVSAQQTFEWPGRIPLRKAIANRDVALAELGLEQFRAALAARARSVVYGLLAAQEKEAAAMEVAGRFRELREVLVQRDPAGLTPRLETRIIEATELTMQRKATEARLASQAALLELNQLRGRPWSESMKVESVVLTFAPVPDTDTLLSAARTNNFELRMRQVELEQQGFRVSLAKKDGFPSVTVGPYFSNEGAGGREQQIGLGISFPLPLWNRNKGGVETAEARRQQAEVSMFVAQRTMERQIVQQALTYQTKLSEMGNWRPESVDEFRGAAVLADRHYRLGAVPVATYVELQKQYLEAVEALLDTRHEALEAGQKIEVLTGLELHMVRTETPKPAVTP